MQKNFEQKSWNQNNVFNPEIEFVYFQEILIYLIGWLEQTTSYSCFSCLDTLCHIHLGGGGDVGRGSLVRGRGAEASGKKTHQCIRKHGIWCVKSMLWEYYLYTAIATIFYFSNCYYLISATPCKLALQRKNRFPGKKKLLFYPFFLL